jgi:hypothetical protein
MRWLAAMVCALAVGSSAGADPKPAPGVLARGARVVEVDHGVVVARRPTGATRVALAVAPADGKLSATLAPFLGDRALLDVTIAETSESGWHYHTREMHYVLDISGAADVVACPFEGASSDGGEYSSTSTTIEVARKARSPLAFDVTRTTTSHASQPQPPPPDTKTKNVAHYVLGTSSCAHTPPSAPSSTSTSTRTDDR